MSKLRFMVSMSTPRRSLLPSPRPVGRVRSLGTIPNRLESVRKMVGKLGRPESYKSCYEAGPTGYVLYWQLTELGVVRGDCADAGADEGRRPGEDGSAGCGEAGACYRAGELTAVWVPDAEHEALRDLVRAREAGKKDQLGRGIGWASFCCATAPAAEAGRPGQRSIWNGSEPRALRTACSGSHAAGLLPRGGTCRRTDCSGWRRAIDEAMRKPPAEIRAVIEALQALRGVAQSRRRRWLRNWAVWRALKVRANDGLQRTGAPASIPAAAHIAARSPRPATRTSAGCWWNRPGRTGIGRDAADAPTPKRQQPLRNRQRSHPPLRLPASSWTSSV